MPLEGKVFNLHEFELEDPTGENPVIVKGRYIGKVDCPRCGQCKLRKKDKKVRVLHHERIGQRPCNFHLTVYKYRCLGCQRYFWQRMPGYVSSRRSTEAFRKQVVRDHVDGISLSKLSCNNGISASTVERWNRDLAQRLVKQDINYPCPRVLGIDEHFFTRKLGYATTFCDLEHHRVYDVALGRSMDSLRPIFQKMQGKRQVRVVVMDMSETYRSIAKKWFPAARIVVDRFHVIRLVNQHFMQLWKSVDESGRRRRGLVSLVRRHPWHLSEEQKPRLQRYLSQFMVLQEAYNLRNRLMRVLLARNVRKQHTVKLAKYFLGLLKRMEGTPLSQLANTLKDWIEEIIGMWRFSRTNGITEGFHTKMELISRRAYGFRNFQNYRLRVRALCA
jgi:transposase